MRLIRRRVIEVALCTTLLWIGTAQAQSVADFYAGKTVTLVVSAPAGSLTDLQARQFKDYFAKHIPGQPEVIVTNVSGAGGMIAASRLQQQEPKDGTVIGFLQRNNLYRTLVEGEKGGFDPHEVSWLGSLDSVAYTIAVSGNSPVRTAQDMFSKTLILGATGVANDNRTLPALMNKYMGTKLRIIHGYSGRGEVYLAMERKEVDGWASTIAGLKEPQQAEMVKSGKLIPIIHLDWHSHPDFPNLPNLADFVTAADARAVIDFFILPFASGRPIAVPKGVPEERLAALHAAFRATVEDRDFLADVARRNWSVDPMSGAAVVDIRDKLYATSQETLEAVRKILAPPR